MRNHLTEKKLRAMLLLLRKMDDECRYFENAKPGRYPCLEIACVAMNWTTPGRDGYRITNDGKAIMDLCVNTGKAIRALRGER